MNSGIAAALGAAFLFGASTPIAKRLIGDIPPVVLAGLFYAGSGAGLAIVDVLRRRSSTSRADADTVSQIAATDWPWLAGAIMLGGIAAPLLLMFGLASTSASSASLLLNLEGVLTAAIAWIVFRENVDVRIAIGMILIVAGGIVLAFEPGATSGISTGALLVAAACACWAIDNNLTRRISASDAVRIAAIKGGIAGAVNLAIAAITGATFPAMASILAALIVGFLCYGVSLVLFVVALRHLGTARTGAYFSVAPFVGAALAFAINVDSPSVQFALAAMLMAIGVALHLTERHEHEHEHGVLDHIHPHSHDAHHQHEHDFAWDGVEPHSHSHVHPPLRHRHPHYPDIHHQHRH